MKKSKTILFGVLVILGAIFADPESKAFIMEHFPSIGGAIGGIIIVLRVVTNSPLFNKSK